MSIADKCVLLAYLLYFGAAPCTATEIVPFHYQRIANEHGVPATLLYGIALGESGQTLRNRKFRPWPWTLNVAGVPRYYPTRWAAWKSLTFYLQQGITSIDVGLMQVNWRYHHKKLGTPWDALDPFHNVRTGANILWQEYQATGSWQKAVGRYHSPGTKPEQQRRAERYRQRVMRRVERLAASND
ncbi:MAG: lytic transglycosylase domain-containing protein [Gammaproteobacteria bacterium]